MGWTGVWLEKKLKKGIWNFQVGLSYYHPSRGETCPLCAFKPCAMDWMHEKSTGVPDHHSSPFSAASSCRVLDVSGMDIVYRGKPWHHYEDPSAKSVGHLLERNESIVTWLQPRGGSVQDQIPAIHVNGVYKCPSLRMQKRIWKHVRLKKGFVNLENLSQVR